MLTARAGDEQLIAPRIPAARARALSKAGTLRCPACEKQVIFRAGPRMISHFAHVAGAACPLDRDPDLRPESETHLGLKLALHDHFAMQPGATVELEARIQETNQRADLLVTVGPRRLALEVQCSPLSGDAWRARHEGYRSVGIEDVWLLAGKPPPCAMIPAVPARRLPASYRVPLSDLAAAILAAEGELLFAWLPGGLAPRSKDLLSRLAREQGRQKGAAMASLHALGAHHAAAGEAPFPVALRRGLTLSGRHAFVAPLVACAVGTPPCSLVLGPAHAAARREALEREAAARR